MEVAPAASVGFPWVEMAAEAEVGPALEAASEEAGEEVPGVAVLCVVQASEVADLVVNSKQVPDLEAGDALAQAALAVAAKASAVVPQVQTLEGLVLVERQLAAPSASPSADFARR